MSDDEEFYPFSKFADDAEAVADMMTGRVQLNGDKGVVDNIKRTAAAIAGEYSRIEALNKIQGSKSTFIPHTDKARLSELAVRLAACCYCLTKRTVQKGHQMRLSDLPENCIVIRDEGKDVVVTGKRLKYMQDLYAAHTNRILAIPENTIADVIVDKIEENKEEISKQLSEEVGGGTTVEITTSRGRKK